MKKLAIALAGALLITAATPVFACPHDEVTNDTKTADKDKSADKDKAKTADKTKTEKAKAPAKKAEEKKPTKVVLN